MIHFFDHGYGEFDKRRGAGPCCWDRFDLLWLHSGKMKFRLMQRRDVVLTAGSGVLIYPDTPFVGWALAAEVSKASVQHFAIEAGARGKGRGAREEGKGTVKESAIRPPLTPRPLPLGDLPAPFARLSGRTRGYEQYHLARTDSFDADVARAIDLSVRRQTPLVHDLRVAQLTLILGTLASHVRGAGRLPIARATVWDHLLTWLTENLDNPPNVAAMAAKMNWSASHFASRFQQDFGLSPARYVQNLRLQEAARLIREGHLPIKAVAKRLGFDDLPNFYRSFRSLTTQTPAAYRLRNRLQG